MVDAALLNWTLNQFLEMLIIMTRVGPLIFLMPITGSRSVPARIKALFTLMTSLALLPLIQVNPADMPATAVGYAIFIMTEITFGAILALFVRFVFAAVELAGQMVSISMGFGMAATMDPQFGTQASLIGQFWNLTAILIFLSLNGHHIFFRTMVESFEWVRPGALHLTQATFEGIMQGAARMFVMAVKVMAPAVAALLFSHVAMGILAKTVPQIPVMIVAMPLNIALGLIFLGLSLSYFLPIMIRDFNMLGRLLTKLAMGMGV